MTVPYLRKLEKPAPEVDAALVESLEKLLEEVKAGRITEVVAAYCPGEHDELMLIHTNTQMRFLIYAAEAIKSRVVFG